MRKFFVFLIIVIFAGNSGAFGYQSLQEIFDNSGPCYGYDRYMVLDPTIEYEGDLDLWTGESVRIIGNGAKIFGNDSTNAIKVYGTGLDISGCVFIGGENALFYMMNAYGKAFNNTVIGADTCGMRTYYRSEDPGVEFYNNIIVDCYYAIGAVEYNLPGYIGYNILYSSIELDYAMYCPG